MESSSWSSSKRGKNNGTQAAPPPPSPQCLVDGCNADLSLCRDYYRRHKVCHVHSKTPMVTVAGRQQRFCQQCSRFHSLVEFDDGKRSCRKRLDGHNRRRRKPQPESGLLFSTQPTTPMGERLLSFSTPVSTNSSSWSGVITSQETDIMQLYNNSFPLVENQEQLQFQIIHSTGNDFIGHNHVVDHALSLLSPAPPDQPVHHNPFDTKPAVVSSNAADSMFQSSSSGSDHQTLTFMWE